ncbi:kinase-like protein [Auricularia subglabra TFB-10046 SS5]|uniref:Kinase-like protein n=1 Tax=Auricularia subglabra (strain TFB-10046 / SS5) TaxID=717982 RepID=J0WPF3_AURST|nr:kinase-like protein [Auricularia subglabra TFB-10046 SS5]
MEHPHVIRCFCSVHVEGCECIVTPWAENGTLGAYLKKHPEADRLKLVCSSQVASGLRHLHRQEPPIVHGDIFVVGGGDNVLISDHGNALLSDFGLSNGIINELSEIPCEGDRRIELFGRAVYEAPERHDGAAQSCSTDVFAFGMLIFHAYSGRRPFSTLSTSAAAIVELHKGRRPDRSEVAR